MIDPKIAEQTDSALRDRDRLEGALLDADIVPLVLAQAQLSGDLSLLEEVAPYITGPWSFEESIPEQYRHRIRRGLVEALEGYSAVEDTSTYANSDLRQLMSLGVGQPVSNEYVPLLLEEMNFDAKDSRAATWQGGRPDEAADFSVTIIGAGLGGICAAIRLKQLGIPFIVLEKNASLGGTWLENSYPGCGVDTPNHFYSFSFNPKHDWSRHFAQRDEILGYIRDTAQKFGILQDIRFNTEVTLASYDEAACVWHIEYQDGTVIGQHESNAVISAVGQLNRASIPRIPGLSDYKGPMFHTAEWDHSVDLKGLKVVMIGTGASAMQAGPTIAPEVEKLTVVQRTPHWTIHNPNYDKDVSPGTTWAIEHIPFYEKWLRFRLFWASSDGFHDSLRVDPEWHQPDVSLNAANHDMRERLVAYAKQELGGDETLLAKVIPNYPPYGKRMLRDNNWFKMLKRDNVELTTGSVDRITEHAVVLEDGTTLEADVIIMATGFSASRMLAPMHIAGRDGVTIRDVWGDDDPRAYLGITVPKFPNFFVTYGPNTNLAHGGSIIFHLESQVRYITQALVNMIENNISEIEVRGDVHDRYNTEVDAACRAMVWSHPRVTSWYKNKDNRVTVTSPWKLKDYWSLTHEFSPADYEQKARVRADVEA